MGAELRKSAEKAAELHVGKFSAETWRTPFYVPDSSEINELAIHGILVRRELDFSEARSKRDAELRRECEEDRIAAAQAASDALGNVEPAIAVERARLAVRLARALDAEQDASELQQIRLRLAELRAIDPSAFSQDNENVHAAEAALVETARHAALIQALDSKNLWCPTMSLVFEVDPNGSADVPVSLDEDSLDLDEGTVRKLKGLGTLAERSTLSREGVFFVRPLENSLTLLRPRAKVVDPTWYVPWTWWTNDRDNAWYAPTLGDKDFIDKLTVKLTLSTVYSELTGEPHVAAESTLFERKYSFKEVLIGKKHQSVRSGSKDENGRLKRRKAPVPWSAPIPAVPRSYVRTGANHLGTGLLTIRAEVTELDSMAERLPGLGKLVEDAVDEGADYASDAIKDLGKDDEEEDSEEDGD